MGSACLYERVWPMLMLGQVGPMLSHRAPLGPILAQVGPMLGYVGPILGPCWAYVGLCWPYGPMLSPLGSYVGAIFGPSMCLKMPIFPSRAPPRAQNHVKTNVLEHRQDKIRGHRSVKNDVFLTPRAKNTVNYRAFSRGGVDTG